MFFWQRQPGHTKLKLGPPGTPEAPLVVVFGKTLYLCCVLTLCFVVPRLSLTEKVWSCSCCGLPSYLHIQVDTSSDSKVLRVIHGC